MEFRDIVKHLRIEKSLSQAALAKKFNKSESAIRAWETGRAKPDADTLILLASFFNCSVDYLLGIDESKNKQDLKAKNERIDYLSQYPYFDEVLAYIEMIALADDSTIGSQENDNSRWNLFVSLLGLISSACQLTMVVEKSDSSSKCYTVDGLKLYCSVTTRIKHNAEREMMHLWNNLTFPMIRYMQKNSPQNERDFIDMALNFLLARLGLDGERGEEIYKINSQNKTPLFFTEEAHNSIGRYWFLMKGGSYATEDNP